MTAVKRSSSDSDTLRSRGVVFFVWVHIQYTHDPFFAMVGKEVSTLSSSLRDKTGISISVSMCFRLDLSIDFRKIYAKIDIWWSKCTRFVQAFIVCSSLEGNTLRKSCKIYSHKIIHLKCEMWNFCDFQDLNLCEFQVVKFSIFGTFSCGYRFFWCR